VAERHGLGEPAVHAFRALLVALEAEPDPPTTARTGVAALETHIADSLSALELDLLGPDATIADVGAGAGFPGLALAAALPGTNVDLIESTRRKCEVIDRLAKAASVDNAQAVAARAEEWGAGAGRGAYDVVTARAVASLPVLAEYAAPLLGEGGLLIAWKGARDDAEERSGAIAAEQVGLAVQGVIQVVPFPRARGRHLHVYSKVSPTPERFPRRPGVARRRPLA
jgi:16S rRNA (guanine527-N7)-methyltransferase